MALVDDGSQHRPQSNALAPILMDFDIANAKLALQKAMNEAFAVRGALKVIAKNDGVAN